MPSWMMGGGGLIVPLRCLNLPHYWDCVGCSLKSGAGIDFNRIRGDNCSKTVSGRSE